MKLYIVVVKYSFGQKPFKPVEFQVRAISPEDASDKTLRLIANEVPGSNGYVKIDSIEEIEELKRAA